MRRRPVGYNSGIPKLDNLLNAIAYGVTIWGATVLAALLGFALYHLGWWGK